MKKYSPITAASTFFVFNSLRYGLKAVTHFYFSYAVLSTHFNNPTNRRTKYFNTTIRKAAKIKNLSTSLFAFQYRINVQCICKCCIHVYGYAPNGRYKHITQSYGLEFSRPPFILLLLTERVRLQISKVKDPNSFNKCQCQDYD